MAIKKKAKKSDAAPASSKRPVVRKGTAIPWDMLSPAARKAIEKADALEVQIEDTKDALAEILGQAREAMDSSSFVHPERGPTSIMFRGFWYWRKKPKGGPKGAKVKAPEKAEKKAPAKKTKKAPPKKVPTKKVAKKAA